MNEPKIDFLIYLMHFIGIPYLWGGKKPDTGLDCSGFTQVALDFFGIDPQGEQNAQSLHALFTEPDNGSVVTGQPELGDLCFFGTDTHIHHVGVALNEHEMLEAAHGDETVTSVAIAQSKNARVMVNPIKRMKDLYAIVRPKGYPWESDDPTNQSSKDPSTQVQSDPNYTVG